MRGSCGWRQGQPGAQADFLSDGSQWGERRRPGPIGSKHSAEWGDTGGFPTALLLEVASLSQGVLEEAQGCLGSVCGEGSAGELPC